MHIIIGFLTALAGLIWALYRLQSAGLDLNSFNPFYWLRRRRWQKQYGAKPLHSLTNPMDAAAALMVATAQLDGDLTREHKQLVLELFTRELKLSDTQAQELYVASCHLLKDSSNVQQEVKHILAPSAKAFTPAQTQSLLSMLAKIASFDGHANNAQQELLQQVENCLCESPEQSQWGT